MTLLKTYAFLFNVVCVFTSFPLFFQNDYKILTERVQVPWINRNIIDEMKTLSFKYNRSEAVYSFNITYKVDIKTWRVRFILYKFSANDYKKTAIQGSYDWCDILRFDAFGIGVTYKINGNYSNCPVKKGSYYIRNAKLDATKFPPNAPEGRAMLETYDTINGEAAMRLQTYLEFKYSVKIRGH